MTYKELPQYRREHPELKPYAQRVYHYRGAEQNSKDAVYNGLVYQLISYPFIDNYGDPAIMVNHPTEMSDQYAEKCYWLLRYTSPIQ